jgi:transposase
VGTLPAPGGWGGARFERAARRQIIRRSGRKPCLRILRAMFSALADPAGVIAHRHGALERVALLLEDRQLTQDRISQAEQRMTAVLDELGLTGLATSITGLSAVGVAAILAETGDPGRFATGRAVVKHAGLAPREKLSGAFTGRTRLTGQGRPGLRLAAWRAVWGAQRANPIYRARYQHLTTREQNKLTPHPGTDRHRRRDLAAPARCHHHQAGLGSGHRNTPHPAGGRCDGRLILPAVLQAGGRGEPSAALRHP